MNSHRLLRRLRTSWIARISVFGGLITLLALSTFFLTRDIRMASGCQQNEHALLAHFLAWSLWTALVSLFLIVRNRILPFVKHRPPIRVLVEVVLGVGYAVISTQVTHAVLSRLVGPPPLPGDFSFEDFRLMMMARAAGMYGFVVVTLTAMRSELERRRSEHAKQRLLLQKETLQNQLSEARLEALQSQIRPHFLFNALHAIGGLILGDDKRRAHRALASLSSLLRSSLTQSNQQTTTVENELDLVRQYLELEQIRFGSRLRFSIEADDGCTRALLPTLILLPLVENAVTHGLEPHPEAVHIDVRVVRSSEELTLTVIDNGAGEITPTTTRRPSTGIGLKNTAARLEALYGPKAAVSLTSRAPRGTVVQIRTPFLTAAPMRAPEVVH